jgi:hypothetical protein
VPLPEDLKHAAVSALNERLRQAIAADPLDLERVRGFLEEARAADVPLDRPGLAYALQKRLEAEMQRFREAPDEAALLETVARACALVREFPEEPNLRRPQNVYWEMLHAELPERRSRAEAGDEAARGWVERFVDLGRSLKIKVE